MISKLSTLFCRAGLTILYSAIFALLPLSDLRAESHHDGDFLIPADSECIPKGIDLVLYTLLVLDLTNKDDHRTSHPPANSEVRLLLARSQASGRAELSQGVNLFVQSQAFSMPGYSPISSRREEGQCRAGTALFSAFSGLSPPTFLSLWPMSRFPVTVS